MMPPFETALLLREVPGVAHGFFSRDGGVSSGPYASLNCSTKLDDDVNNVKENRNRVLNALGLRGHKLMLPNLVHGNNVAVLDDDHDEENTSAIDADAVITSMRDHALAITFADCLPILVSSVDGQYIAAIHAGWRGLKSGVIRSLVDAIVSRCGNVPLVAAIGPCISEEGFTVTGDVKDYFLARWPEFITTRNDLCHVNLQAIARKQLEACQISHISCVGGFTDRDRKYFSHRREKGQTGRQIAIIAKT